MTWQAVFCLCVLALVFYGLIRNRSADALMLGALVLVTVTGIVTPKDAVAGFSNMGMLTVGALYVVAAALRETGALDLFGKYVLGKARTERGAFIRLAGSVTVMSAFLNNTPLVAMMIPVIGDLCRSTGLSKARLYMPLSFVSILGASSWQALVPAIILNGIILIYCLLPGTKAAFGEA